VSKVEVFYPDGAWFTFVGRRSHAARVAFYVGGDDLHIEGSPEQVTPEA
jgi:hypothetical protein